MRFVEGSFKWGSSGNWWGCRRWHSILGSENFDAVDTRNISRVALCISKVKVPSVSQWVSQSVTRSPIELFWTAKNLGNQVIRSYTFRIYFHIELFLLWSNVGCWLVFTWTVHFVQAQDGRQWLASTKRNILMLVKHTFMMNAIAQSFANWFQNYQEGKYSINHVSCHFAFFRYITTSPIWFIIQYRVFFVWFG